MRVALYERVSTEEQSLHGLSIEAQKAALSEWAKDKVIVDHYTDLGVSARKPILKRPELQRLLRDVEAGKIDVVAFTRLDRWTRNIREYYKAQDILEANGVAWTALHEGYTTETAQGRLTVNLMLSIAQNEADITSERIKAVFDDKRRRGLEATGSVPIGLQIVDGKCVPSNDAQTVRDIFNEYISSRSARGTAIKFGYTAEGLRWILHNERYRAAGVVSEEMWDTAQQILKTRSQRHVRSDRVYLFSGLLFCRCGGRMTSAAVERKGKTYIYYRCSTNSHSGTCSGSFVSERKVEQFLLDNTIRKAEEHNLYIAGIRKPGNVPKLQSRLDKLTDLYLSDLISREKYEAEYRAIQSKLTEAQKEPKPVDTHELRTIMGAYQSLTREAKKAFWSHLVERVDITENGMEIRLINT